MTSRRTARGNRIGLLVVGALLLAGGGVVLARGLGAFGAARTSLLTPAVLRYAQEQAWVWPVVAAFGAVVFLLGLRWLLVQWRTGTLRSLTLESERVTGGTRMPAGAVTDAVEEEITSYPGVHRVHATLGGAASVPRLWLAVTCEDRAELGVLRDRIRDEALGNASSVLEVDGVPTVMRLRLASGGRGPRTK